MDDVRNVVEWQLDDTLDINGWDLKKALQLLHNSNPTLFEWGASPIIYHKTKAFDELKALLPKYFSQKKSLFHYWHMASMNYREYLKGDMVRIKKYFYVLRPLLAAKWVVNRNCPPPMKFSELVEAELPRELLVEVNKLLEMKKSTSELGYAPKVVL